MKTRGGAHVAGGAAAPNCEKPHAKALNYALLGFQVRLGDLMVKVFFKSSRTTLLPKL